MESMMMENVKESSKAVQQKNSLNALIHWLDLHLEETFLGSIINVGVLWTLLFTRPLVLR